MFSLSTSHFKLERPRKFILEALASSFMALKAQNTLYRPYACCCTCSQFGDLWLPTREEIKICGYVVGKIHFQD